MVGTVKRHLADLPAEVRAIIAHEPNDSLNVVEPQAVFVRILEDYPRLRWEGGLAFFTMEDIVAAGRNPAITSDFPMGYAGMGAREALIPLHLHGDLHRRFRRLLDPLLTPRRVAGLEAVVRSLASDLVDGFVSDGRVELHDAFAVPLPCITFLELFGLPLDDFEFLNATKDEILKNDGTTLAEHLELSTAAGDRLREHLGRRLDEYQERGETRDDLIGAFLSFEVDGTRLSRSDMVNIMHLFTIAGLDTVTASLSCIVSWFARHPEQRRQVVANPDLLPAAIEELMRYENPVLVGGPRLATEDTEVNGCPVRSGDMVSLCWSTANLDPASFRDPLRVDFERSANSHIAFAAGIHRCLGSHLARLELRTAIAELHRRIPDYEIDPTDGPRYESAGVRAATHLPLVFAAGGRSGEETT
jgi:cytochrome P450